MQRYLFTAENHTALTRLPTSSRTRTCVLSDDRNASINETTLSPVCLAGNKFLGGAVLHPGTCRATSHPTLRGCDRLFDIYNDRRRTTSNKMPWNTTICAAAAATAAAPQNKTRHHQSYHGIGFPYCFLSLWNRTSSRPLYLAKASSTVLSFSGLFWEYRQGRGAGEG